MSNNSLPDIFAQTPTAIAPSQTIAEFPVNTFLENIAIDPQGNLFINSYEEGKVYRVTPTGKVETFAQIEGNLAGIVIDPQGNLLVAGAMSDKTQAVFRIAQDGTVETLITLPDAIFLNGMTPLTSDRYLIADSFKGAIWEIDAISRTAEIWLQDDCLAPSKTNPSPFPAANGIKIYANTLYVSNTQRQHLIRILIANDDSAGIPELFLKEVNLDDFAFDVEGNLYAATHVYNSVVKISPEGQVTTIATSGQGMAGSTAVAFGRANIDRTSVYVTTNGGMSLPLPSGIEPGKVVRLDIGRVGNLL
jgi:sugar lactone lactonase YvrE